MAQKNERTERTPGGVRFSKLVALGDRVYDFNGLIGQDQISWALDRPGFVKEIPDIDTLGFQMTRFGNPSQRFLSLKATTNRRVDGGNAVTLNSLEKGITVENQPEFDLGLEAHYLVSNLHHLTSWSGKRLYIPDSESTSYWLTKPGFEDPQNFIRIDNDGFGNQISTADPERDVKFSKEDALEMHLKSQFNPPIGVAWKKSLDLRGHLEVEEPDVSSPIIRKWIKRISVQEDGSVEEFGFFVRDMMPGGFPVRTKALGGIQSIVIEDKTQEGMIAIACLLRPDGQDRYSLDLKIPDPNFEDMEVVYRNRRFNGLHLYYDSGNVRETFERPHDQSLRENLKDLANIYGIEGIKEFFPQEFGTKEEWDEYYSNLEKLGIPRETPLMIAFMLEGDKPRPPKVTLQGVLLSELRRAFTYDLHQPGTKDELKEPVIVDFLEKFNSVISPLREQLGLEDPALFELFLLIKTMNQLSSVDRKRFSDIGPENRVEAIKDAIKQVAVKHIGEYNKRLFHAGDFALHMKSDGDKPEGVKAHLSGTVDEHFLLFGQEIIIGDIGFKIEEIDQKKALTVRRLGIRGSSFKVWFNNSIDEEAFAQDITGEDKADWIKGMRHIKAGFSKI